LRECKVLSSPRTPRRLSLVSNLARMWSTLPCSHSHFSLPSKVDGHALSSDSYQQCSWLCGRPLRMCALSTIWQLAGINNAGSLLNENCTRRPSEKSYLAKTPFGTGRRGQGFVRARACWRRDSLKEVEQNKQQFRNHSNAMKTSEPSLQSKTTSPLKEQKKQLKTNSQVRDLLAWGKQEREKHVIAWTK